MDTVKVKVTRTDGVVVEVEGTVDDVLKLAPQVIPVWWNLTQPLAGGVVLNPAPFKIY